MAFEPYDPSSRYRGTYPDLRPEVIAHVEIFPPVGIARVGNSGESYYGNLEYFYGPEVPGRTDHLFGNFRDSHKAIRRQAVRFRVYAYGWDNEILGEINNERGYELRWEVHVANKKAANYLFRGRHHSPTKSLRNPDVDPVEDGEVMHPEDPLDRALEGRGRLIIDPGMQGIVRTPDNPNEEQPLTGMFQGSVNASCSVNLGELRTDALGRLVVIPGSGHSNSVKDLNNPKPEIFSEFDSIDWYDDVFDGWVDVTVSHSDIMDWRIQATHKATVISAPPKFSYGIEAPTSLYDVFEDMYSEHFLDHIGTEFYKDIWPVLSATCGISWTNSKAQRGHGPNSFGDYLAIEKELATVPSPANSDTHKSLRDAIFSRLREPKHKNKDQANTTFMPRLSGDDGDALEPGTIPSLKRHPDPIRRFASLTSLQYERFKRWRDGEFTNEPFVQENAKAIEEYPIELQPSMLTRAALEQTIGDPLYPGMETFWVMRDPQVYDTENISPWLKPPFRINHEKVLPGFLGRGLSLPWQSDFDLCSTHWWPSIRPDDVILGSEADFIIKKLVQDGKTPRQIASFIGNNAPRKQWNRDMRETISPVNYLPGSTDMIRYWDRLGFVARVDIVDSNADPTSVPIWTEQERLSLEVDGGRERHAFVGHREPIDKAMDTFFTVL